MKPAVICFDLDGTLVNQEGMIHPNDKTLLTAAPPSIVFIGCTGRSLESTKRTFQKNVLFLDKPIPIPLVLLNGTLVYGRNEEFLEYTPFDQDQQEKLIARAKKAKDITFLFLTREATYVLGENQFGCELIKKYEFSPLPFNQWESSAAFSKVMCISNNAETLRDFDDENKKDPLEQEFSMPTILEITPFGRNKGKAIIRLIQYYSLNNSNIFAAGDGGNDLSMIPVADVFFAPCTAPRGIKEKASQVIDVKNAGLLSEMIKSQE